MEAGQVEAMGTGASLVGTTEEAGLVAVALVEAARCWEEVIVVVAAELVEEEVEAAQEAEVAEAGLHDSW